jgi:hypothetical protein
MDQQLKSCTLGHYSIVKFIADGLSKQLVMDEYSPYDYQGTLLVPRCIKKGRQTPPHFPQ